MTPLLKLSRKLARQDFETAGWRTIELARGLVTFPDGRHCRFNVRLMADQGSEGDIHLIAEDINTQTTKRIRLKRRK